MAYYTAMARRASGNNSGNKRYRYIINIEQNAGAMKEDIRQQNNYKEKKIMKKNSSDYAIYHCCVKAYTYCIYH